MNMRRFLARWYRQNRSRFPVPRGADFFDAGDRAYHRSWYRLGGLVLFWGRRPVTFLKLRWCIFRIWLGLPPPMRIRA